MHQTRPQLQTIYCKSFSARLELSQERRLALGSAIRSAYADKVASARYHRVPIVQWFSEREEGSLTQPQIAAIQRAYPAKPREDGAGLKLSTFNLEEVQKALGDALPKLRIARDLGDYKQRYSEGHEVIHRDDPQMYIQTSSRLWEESITFLSYHFGQHYFPLTDADADTWMRDFIGNDNRLRRIAAVQKLQFDTLMTAKVVPLVAGPHFDLLRSTWKKSDNQISSASMLWEIEKR